VKRGAQRGFTLAELLIVIIIIGILAAIAIPMFLDQREKVKDSAVKEGTHSLQIAVQTYAVDHEALCPDPSDVDAGGALAGYIDSWPLNPFTGKPMVNANGGYSKGDFSYDALGSRGHGGPVKPPRPLFADRLDLERRAAVRGGRSSGSSELSDRRYTSGHG
jgi:prepilin-type N-terminal cleavage/methylation domain-containing protein